MNNASGGAATTRFSIMAARAGRDTVEEEPIQAQIGLALFAGSGGDDAGTTPPDWIQYMPAGEHRITARRGGRKVTLTVQADREGAEALQEALQAHLAEDRQKPFIDFDHEGKRAAAWPIEFAWRDTPEPGIYCRVRWSESGAKAVAGRDYRSFSPTFYTAGSNPAKVAGAPLMMGALVNDPAFREIAPLWARDGGTLNPPDDPTQTMTDKELAELKAKRSTLEKENAELKAAAARSDQNAIKAKQAEIEKQQKAIEAKEAQIKEVRDKLTEVEQALHARREQDADEAVKAAVARGAIPPKDETVQKRWKDLILANPDNAELLGKLPGKPAVQAGRMTSGQAPAKSGDPKGKVQITQEDTNQVLQAYVEAKSPTDRGQLYRAEIDPRLDQGERVPFERLKPVMAANVLGTLVGDIISQRTLALIVSKRPFLTSVVTDFSDEGARKGQAVYTRTVGIPAVNNFASGAVDTADTDYSITLSNHKEVHYAFATTEYLATNRNLVAEHSEAMAVALGNSMVDAVAALITDAFTSETTGAASTKTYSDLTAAANALNTAGAPTFNRNVWVNSGFAEALSNDEVVMQFVTSNIADAYGNWRNVKGFRNVWEYPALPGNSVNLIGFAFQQNALLLAARVADDVESLAGAGYPGALQVVTDPVTGLSVLTDRFITTTARQVNARMDVLYGAARGVVTCGHKFVTT